LAHRDKSGTIKLSGELLRPQPDCRGRRGEKKDFGKTKQAETLDTPQGISMPGQSGGCKRENLLRVGKGELGVCTAESAVYKRVVKKDVCSEIQAKHRGTTNG